MSARLCIRELISRVGVLEANSGAVDDGPLMLTASPKRHAKTATDYFLSELYVHTDASSRGKKLSSSKQLLTRPMSPLGTDSGGRAVKMVGGSDEHAAAAEEEDEMDAIKKRRFIREIRRLNKRLALLPRSMRYQRWLYPYTVHAHAHPHTHTHTHTYTQVLAHTGALTHKHD